MAAPAARTAGRPPLGGPVAARGSTSPLPGHRAGPGCARIAGTPGRAPAGPKPARGAAARARPAYHAESQRRSGRPAGSRAPRWLRPRGPARASSPRSGASTARGGRRRRPPGRRSDCHRPHPRPGAAPRARARSAALGPSPGPPRPARRAPGHPPRGRRAPGRPRRGRRPPARPPRDAPPGPRQAALDVTGRPPPGPPPRAWRPPARPPPARRPPGPRARRRCRVVARGPPPTGPWRSRSGHPNPADRVAAALPSVLAAPQRANRAPPAAAAPAWHLRADRPGHQRPAAAAVARRLRRPRKGHNQRCRPVASRLVAPPAGVAPRSGAGASGAAPAAGGGASILLPPPAQRHRAVGPLPRSAPTPSATDGLGGTSSDQPPAATPSGEEDRNRDHFRQTLRRLRPTPPCRGSGALPPAVPLAPLADPPPASSRLTRWWWPPSS